MLKKLKQNLFERAEDEFSHVTALDIGTEYVKALIAKIDGDNLEIIGTGRAHQNLSDMHSGAIADIDGVVRNCETALSEAEDQADVSAHRTVIGIAGELVKGRTSTITYKRPDSKKEMDWLELESIMKRVQVRAMDRERMQLAWETGNKDLEVKLVNSAVVSMHVDGYAITNPIGFTGRELKIQLYTAFAPMVHIGALERTANDLDLDLIAVAAEPFAVSRAVTRNDANDPFSAVLIDIGGGTTDIAVVNEGGVEGTKMFGIGGRSFTQTLANELNYEFMIAEELKLKTSSGTIAEDMKKAAEKAINKTLDVWIGGVQITLNEFTAVDHLPSRILLCGGGASLSQLVERLKDSDWYKECAFTKRPTIQHITPDQVIGITDSTEKVNDHTFITAMGLLRIGLDTVESAPENETNIRDTINKLLRI